jgi:hypothetical protein
MNPKLLNSLKAAAAMAVALFLVCAPKPRNNPLDPGGEAYEVPKLEDNAIPLPQTPATPVTNNAVNFTIDGSSTQREYSYAVDDTSKWTPWATSVHVNEILDDGTHTLYVRSRYLEGADIQLTTREFTVSTLVAPAVYLTPRKVVAPANRATFRVYGKGLPPLLSVHIEVSGAALREVKVNIAPDGQYQTLITGNIAEIGLLPQAALVQGDVYIGDIVVEKGSAEQMARVTMNCSVKDTNNVTVSNLMNGDGYISAQ